jgi:DNA polymerase-3 subunit delta'
MLITGPAGSGLAHFAMLVLGARLCAAPSADGLPCGACRPCEWRAAGHHPDMLRLGRDVVMPADAGADEDGEKGAKKSERSRGIAVGDVRELIAFMQVNANDGAGRCAILSPADAMNSAASNALLKILEEPPSGAAIVLASAHETRLLPTVRSRCNVIRLPRPTTSESAAWLASAGVERASLALDLAGQAPLAAAELTGEYWDARERLLGFLAADGRERRVGVRDLETVAPTFVQSVLHTWVCDLISCSAAQRVRYHTDRRDALARASSAMSLPALLKFERRLRHAGALADHPLNPKLVVADLLLGYAGCRHTT